MSFAISVPLRRNALKKSIVISQHKTAPICVLSRSILANHTANTVGLQSAKIPAYLSIVTEMKWTEVISAFYNSSRIPDLILDPMTQPAQNGSFAHSPLNPKCNTGVTLGLPTALLRDTAMRSQLSREPARWTTHVAL